MTKSAFSTIFCGFGSLMDIDKLILWMARPSKPGRFGSLMDIDKLIQSTIYSAAADGFGSLMDIDKLIRLPGGQLQRPVLVL